MCVPTSPAVSVNRRTLLSGLGAMTGLTALSACSAGGVRPAPPIGQTAPPDVASSPLEIVLLGTQGGPPVDTTRAGIATALVVDGATYVIDCGRGAPTQYAKAGLAFAALKGIFITHLHADHVADYYDFFSLAGAAPNSHGDSVRNPVDVYGPGPAGGLPDKFGGGMAPTVAPESPTPGISELTDRCHEAYAYSTNVFLRDSGGVDIRELTRVHEIALPNSGANFRNTSPPTEPFTVMEDDRVRVSATLVPHGPVFPSFAFRFDTDYGSVTFSGDTTYSENLVKLAANSAALVHEAANIRGATQIPAALRDHFVKSHVEVQEVGPIAQRSGADRLILSHLGDLATGTIDATRWRSWAQNGYDGEVVVGQDLQRIPLA